MSNFSQKEPKYVNTNIRYRRDLCIIFLTLFLKILEKVLFVHKSDIIKKDFRLVNLTLKRQPDKMVKNTRTICRQFADKLVDCI